ncbi:NYN domain-containing protein [Rhodoblastus sp.]|uniref:NYN domain-containing protein n=1 Tax=Rhodoblastus sp. TaxID=1962975 RepID=UPI0035B3B238
MTIIRPSGEFGSGTLTPRLAVLIDADNVQPSTIEGVLAEVARLGDAIVKRIYGDFTLSNNSSWAKTIQKGELKPVQQFAYTTGKNATDIALVIDAMDLLHTRKFDGFCLVSSDSDFTGLAMRIREEGLTVFGFGAEKAPEAFRNACHRFILAEKPAPVAERTDCSLGAAPTPKKPAPPAKDAREIPSNLMQEALAQSSPDRERWVHLGLFGQKLKQLNFAHKDYGYPKLSHLVNENPELFDVQERLQPGRSSGNLYVRAK